MTSPIERMSYTLAQRLRAGWFAGHYALAARLSPPTPRRRKPARPGPSWRAVEEDLQALFRRDWDNIAAGRYRHPHDMWPNPLAVLRQSLRFFDDLAAVNRRKRLRRGEDLSMLPLRGRYPPYYLQNFHFQTDGYLSDHSARLYDYQVEVLFTGGADAMRRQLLVPLGEFFRERRIREARLLDLACGTARFLTFVKDNYPRLAVTGADMSEPYLAEARRRLRRWSRVDLVAANAERLPFPDRSFDVVTCIFLFHELPRQVRHGIAAEMARVLRPDGLALFMDSIQLGDHPPYDPLLGRFPAAMHEPYYADYVADDLVGLFRECGLATRAVDRAFFSRMMELRSIG